MGITLNQRRFLEGKGFNVEGWTYEQASAKISELKNTSYKGKTTYQPQTEFVESQNYKPRQKEPFEAHLSIEQVRYNALQIALALTKIPNDERVLLNVADNIVHWMLTGTRAVAETKK